MSGVQGFGLMGTGLLGVTTRPDLMDVETVSDLTDEEAEVNFMSKEAFP